VTDERAGGGGGLWDGAEVIHTYTREEAIADGYLVDLTEWGSSKTGFLGGFTCPVAVTRELWELIDTKVRGQDTRGRAHDVLWMASLAVRRAREDEDGCRDAPFKLILPGQGRKQTQVLRVRFNRYEGITISFAATRAPEAPSTSAGQPEDRAKGMARVVDAIARQLAERSR
jgi:hypothetical protein